MSFSFGCDISTTASPDQAAPIVLKQLKKLGYKQKSEGSKLPATLKWGSFGLELIATATADFLPIAFIPGVWSRTMPSKITVRKNGGNHMHSVIRIDSAPITSPNSFAKPHFKKHMEKVALSLQREGFMSHASELTDNQKQQDSSKSKPKAET